MLNLNDNTPSRSLIGRLLFERRKSKISQPAAVGSRAGSRFDDYVVPLSRTQRRVDMDDWTRALNQAQNADNPSRVALLDLYDSLLKDSHLASAMESRVLRVMRSKFKLVDAKGKDRPDLLPLFETRWFDQFVRYAMEGAFLGYTLIELGELAEVGKLSQVYRPNPRNVVPQTGLIVRNPGDTTGINYRKGAYANYIIEVGRAEDLGLLEAVAPMVIFKKYAAGSWSEYTEKFGVPSRWVSTDTTDARRYRQLADVMQGMLSRGWAILQGTEKIEMAPTPATDAHKVFDEFISRCNSEISKRLLGQDGTSDNKDATGTYGSLKVLQGVAEDRHLADKARCRYLVNDELMPRLINLGYPLTGIRFQWDEFSELTPKDLVDSVQKLSTLYEVDPKYIEEKTGIRINGIRRMPGEFPGGGGGGTHPARKDDPGATLDDPGRGPRIIGFKRDAMAGAWPPWKDTPCCGPTAATEDAPSDDTAIDETLRLVYDTGAEWSQPYFEHVSGRLSEGLRRGFANELDNLSYSQPDHVARTLMEANIFRFSAAKTVAFTNELNRHVTESSGWADFKKRVDNVIDDYDKNYLRTEYDLAVQTGIQASKYYDLVRNKEALPYWEYVTAGDDQVRPAHAALDGKRFRADDAIWGTIYPPNGWRCRCTVLASSDAGSQGVETRSAEELLGAEQIATMAKGGFDRNRAKVGEVFDMNQAYRKELGAKAGKEMKFGLKDSYPGQDMSGKALAERGLPKPPATMDQGQAAQWHANNKDANGNAVITDYAGRPVVLGADDFARHLAKAGRAELVGGIAAALSEPDEVWFQGGSHGSYGMAYFKFWDGQTLKVVTHIDKSTGYLGIASWVATSNDSERQGKLIKPLERQ